MVSVTGCQGIGGFESQLGWRHLCVPPRDADIFTYLLRSEQTIRGDAERLADNIKHRLLKSRAKTIVPEEVRRLCANAAGDGGIGCLLPGVVDDGFANSHDVGCIRENFDDLDNTPIAH